MKIRHAQMTVLADHGEALFEDRLVQVLLEHHPGAVDGLPDQQLRRYVRIALAKGRSHGFTWQSALAGFCVLMFEVAPNFDLHPAFKRALAIRLPDENQRIKAIYANTTGEDWEDARAFADPGAWGVESGVDA